MGFERFRVGGKCFECGEKGIGRPWIGRKVVARNWVSRALRYLIEEVFAMETLHWRDSTIKPKKHY